MNTREYTLVLPGVAATAAFARRLAPVLVSGTRIGLSGPLGAGKTEFVRQLVTALGGDAAVVCSPTYVLEAVYPISKESAAHPEIRSVRHWDLYRLEAGRVPEELFDEHGSPEQITLVEWPERAEEWNASEDLRIDLSLPEDESAVSNPDGDRRTVRLVARSDEIAARLHAAFNGWTWNG